MAKTPVSVKKRPDLKEITKIQKALIKSGRVKVGFPKGTGSYDDGQSIVEVAIWNEFGTENIPPRPFMRNSIAAHKNEYREKGRQLAKDLLKKPDTEAIRKGLEEIGALAASDIQQSITDLRDPPNADSTIARKGSSNPLIHTGKMRQSVTYKVEI